MDFSPHSPRAILAKGKHCRLKRDIFGTPSRWSLVAPFGLIGVCQVRRTCSMLFCFAGKRITTIQTNALACCRHSHLKVIISGICVFPCSLYCVLYCIEDTSTEIERWFSHRLATMDCKRIIHVFHEADIEYFWDIIERYEQSN